MTDVAKADASTTGFINLNVTGSTQGSEPQSPLRTVSQILDDAPTSRFHHRAVLISGMGFFTDAYDLFVIGTVAAMVKTQWHLSTTQTSWVTGAAVLGAFIGAFVFGRLADVLGRKVVYTAVAAIMVVGALGSALAPSFLWLIIARLVIGLGIGGDYPVSAVLVSEYSNRADRGRLVGLVFSMQAIGLIVGPLVALALLSLGVDNSLVWRILLGLGAIPAAAVIYLRAKMPESPRYTALVQGRSNEAARDLHQFAAGAVDASTYSDEGQHLMKLRQLLAQPRMLLMLVGTAGCWFLFDYAYYGNTLSLPSILSQVSPDADTKMKLLLSLALFVVFALPGYLLAVWKMDRIGHRRLQFVGFAVMGFCFLLLALVPSLTTSVAPFVAIFGVSYLFTEFGPNMTTFVLPSEVFPVNMRTTGHGVAAGVGKLGAFVGVFLVPQLVTHIGLRGVLYVAGGAAALGFLLTSVLPETSGRSLEEISGEEKLGGPVRTSSNDA